MSISWSRLSFSARVTLYYQINLWIGQKIEFGIWRLQPA
jgi:hypothetical protein